MPFKPQIVNTELNAAVNVLASENFQFVEGGATIDKSELGSGLVVGQAVAKNAGGKWVKYVDIDAPVEGGDTYADSGYLDLGIMNIDLDPATVDVVVGEIIVVGSVYDAKLTGVTPKFKEAAKQLRFVSHA